MVTIDTKELLEILDETPSTQNIMLAGKHGIGKSEILTNYFTSKGQKVISLFLGQMSDPGDLIGLQRTSSDGTKTDFLPPYWFPTDNKPIVLFLDELNRARPEVLQTIMDLALNRTLAGKKLPEGSRIISAVNSGDQYQLTELDPALISRFNLYDFKPSVEDWLEWATRQKLDERVIAFIRKNPQSLDGEYGEQIPSNVMIPVNMEKTPDRRGWERVSNIIKGKELLSRTMCKLLCGIIGLKTGLTFYNSLAKKNTITGHDVLSSFARILPNLANLSIPQFSQINKEIFEELNSHSFSAETEMICANNCTDYIKYLTDKRASIANTVVEHFITMFSSNAYKRANLFIVRAAPELYNKISHFLEKI